MSDVTSLRTDYRSGRLSEDDTRDDPFEQLALWLDEAIAEQVPEPNAMTLATVGPGGQPSARIVLLRGHSRDGLDFYTNYESRKGQELAANSHAALLFFWPTLERQIRVEGGVVRLSEEASTEYFHSRPRASQLGAWASEQSATVESRSVLERRLAELEETYQDREIPKPPFWGGYRLTPSAFEFWQGRPGRLHDRIRYRRADGETETPWTRDRLQP